jgi:hypothetical protein
LGIVANLAGPSGDPSAEFGANASGNGTGAIQPPSLAGQALDIPLAGTTVNYQIAPGSQLTLAFDPAQAQVGVQRQDRATQRDSRRR